MIAKHKQQIFDFCKFFVSERITRIQNQISEIQVSLASETKSSAGDKHETGRAMLQLEREKLGQQLSAAEKMHQTLSKVPLKINLDRICLGSWVKTTNAQYFLAVSAGEYKEANTSTYCISAATPIGQLLFGKSVGDTFFFNGKNIKIIEIA